MSLETAEAMWETINKGEKLSKAIPLKTDLKKNINGSFQSGDCALLEYKAEYI